MAYPNWDEQTMRKRTRRRLLALGRVEKRLSSGRVRRSPISAN